MNIKMFFTASAKNSNAAEQVKARKSNGVRKMANIMLTMLIVVCCSSCSSSYKALQSPNSMVKFTKSDFELSDQVSAEGTTVRVFCIDWSEIFKRKAGRFKTPVFSPSVTIFNSSERKAIYSLLQNNPGYDVVFYPSTERKVNAFLWILFSREKTRVTARLGKLKQ